MADITKTSATLSFENVFVDGDTRTFSVKNPKANITDEEIEELSDYMQQNNLLISDKWGGNFGRIVKVTRTRTLSRYLDIAGN